MGCTLPSCQLEAEASGSDLLAETERVSEVFCDKTSAVDMQLNQVFLKLLMSELGFFL